MLTRAEIDQLLVELEASLPAMAVDRSTFPDQFNDAYFAIAEQVGARGHRYLEN